MAGVYQRPSTAPDRWHYLQRRLCDEQLHAVLRFSSPLDDKAIKEGVLRLLRRFPILTSRWIEGRKPYWQERENWPTMPLFMLVRCDDPLAEVHSFIAVPNDPSHDPLLQVRLFRGKEDVLGIKLSQVVGDAIALKEVVAFLSSNAQEDEAGGEAIEPDPRERELKVRRTILEFHRWPFQASSVGRSSKTDRETFWVFPFTGLEARGRVSLHRWLKEEVSEHLRAYASENDLAVREVAFTAFVMALFDIVSPQEGVPVPFVLELPLEQGKKMSPMAHHYGRMELRFSRRTGLPPPDLLAEVQETWQRSLRRGDRERDVADIQREYGGRAYDRARERFAQTYERAVKRRHVVPRFLDLGELHPEDASFGGKPPLDAYLTSPIAYPPGSILGWGGYAGRYYLNLGFCEYGVDPQLAASFLQLMESHILSLSGTK